MMKVLKIVICLFTLICFGQNSINDNVYILKTDIYQKSFKSSTQIINEGEKMLKISHTDDEVSKGYFYLFVGYYLKGNFSKSIFYAKKADLLFLKNNKEKEHFIACYYLSLSYHKSGILQKATQYLNEAEKTAQKLDDSYLLAMTLKLKAISLEDEKRFSEAIPYRVRCNSYLKESIEKKRSQFIISEFAFARCYLAFDYLMAGNLQEAKKQISVFESNNDISQMSEGFNWRSEIYYVCKAVIAAKEKDKINAADYFDKAIDIARKSEMDERLTVLLEQRLKLNIDTSEKREQLFAEFIKHKDHSKKENIKVINGEISRQDVNLEHQKEYKYIFIVVAVFLSVGVLVFKRRKRKKQKVYFEEIIKELESNKKHEIFDKLEEDTSEEAILTCSESKSNDLLDATKFDLLKKLERFEKGKAFTAKNFTKSTLVSILDTNTKYINRIIKEHSGKSYNDYINDLRIKYILEYLHENPESCKYKLTHLSELAGFSSHSYFTKVFTKKTKITPSKFISSLAEKNKNVD
ncbi:helix-turn-helix domain-containing protein [Chryseobacterium sp. YIM B08800]|uniref:helix-turn-helix domain-containing protein n=1 Tax=Chryseobacterium sp. YIM B08800 TaxID=2984136 RepID=UPI00223EB674|nr:helix-turn-helix domain-containing protein [Chryseobacterium sp. YIM B08800]